MKHGAFFLLITCVQTKAIFFFLVYLASLLQAQLGARDSSFVSATHLRHAHHLAVKVFDRHAQQTVRFVTGTGVDVVVETRVLKKTEKAVLKRNASGGEQRADVL